VKSLSFKKFFKKSGIAILLLFLLPLLWVGYFMVKNDAPILNGDIIYNQPYKTGFSLDIYPPTKVIYKKSPTIFFIHGGAWITGRKESINNNRFHKAINLLRDEGYTIISPEYTLAEVGKSPFPSCIIDVNDAIVWVKAHAEEYHIDLKNLGIWGESAGAHLALMNAIRSSYAFDSTFEATHFNYVVDIYGPTVLEGVYHSEMADSVEHILEELPDFFKDDFDIALQVFGFDPRQDTARANNLMETYSPLNYLRADAPPILMIHGSADQVVPAKQSILLKQKLDSLSVENELHLLEGVNHAFFGANEEQRNTSQNWIAKFIQKQYRKQP
jgi:acetyl esterase/lipase